MPSWQFEIKVEHKLPGAEFTNALTMTNMLVATIMIVNRPHEQRTIRDTILNLTVVGALVSLPLPLLVNALVNDHW